MYVPGAKMSSALAQTRDSYCRVLMLAGVLRTSQAPANIPWQRRWFKRRQAIEPAIGHAKAYNRMDRRRLQGALGDALRALICSEGYNIRWLARAIVRLVAKRHLFALPNLALYARISVLWSVNALRRSLRIVVLPSAAERTSTNVRRSRPFR